MTQGAGQGPDVENGGTAHDAGAGSGAGARAGEPTSGAPDRPVPPAGTAMPGPTATGPGHAGPAGAGPGRGFGAPEPGEDYEIAEPLGEFGAPEAGRGFGVAEPRREFGAPGPGRAPDVAEPRRGFGAPEPGGDYEIAEPLGAFGAPQAAGEPAFTETTRGFGSAEPGGVFGAPGPAFATGGGAGTGREPGDEPEAGPVSGGRGEMPPGYTETARDLPVVQDVAADVPEPTMLDVPAATAGNDGEGPLYVVGDVHGYLDELRSALRQFGIIDAEDHWIAENARLWFLGDFTDRGPDGIGVIELVMQLSAEAAAAGGYCKALLGNHELLLLGAKRFGDTPVNSGAGTASFQAAWLLNGGQRTDMERLRDHHLQWMSRLDAIALADHHLLVHSDANCYLDYGRTIEDVNDALTEALQRNDAEETWDLFRKFTKRFAFRDEEAGPPAVRELLDTFGGKRIVHGHSPIPYLLGQVGGEDSEDSDGGESAPNVTGPHVYADGLAVAMDGGVTMAGKLLIAQLPLVQ